MLYYVQGSFVQYVQGSFVQYVQGRCVQYVQGRCVQYVRIGISFIALGLFTKGMFAKLKVDCGYKYCFFVI